MQKILSYSGRSKDFLLWLGWLAHYGQGKTLAQFNKWLTEKPERQKLLEYPF